MPKPKKAEGKQDFLNRCTAEVMDREGKEPDQAFAMCNAYWDDAKSQRSAMILSAPLEMAPAGSGEEPGRGFLITAYTGAVVKSLWGKLLIDVGGIKAAPKMPILREHLRDRVVGYSVKAWKDKQNFLIQGEFSQKTRDSQEVFDLADEGFPWQASIGVWPEKIQVLQSEKESARVNGREVSGPLEIWRETSVREVSFCALGADAETAAIVLSADPDGEKVPVIIERAHKQEAKEPMEINLKLLEDQEPGLLGEIREAARAEGLAAGRVEGLSEGVAQERARVVEILETPGNVALKLQAVKDGLAVKDAFRLLLDDQEAEKAKALAEMHKGAPPPMGQTPPASTDPGTFEAKVEQLMVEKQLTRGEAIRLAAREFPELHTVFIQRQKPGEPE